MCCLIKFIDDLNPSFCTIVYTLSFDLSLNLGFRTIIVFLSLRQFLRMIVPLAVLLFLTSVTDAARAVWALNAGGSGHRSVDGIVYNADADIPGTTSDHGVHHIPLLARVHPQVSGQ